MNALPPEWRHATLDELVAAVPNAMTDGPFGSNLKSTHYRDEGARVIRLQNIGDGVFKPADAFIEISHFEALRRHEVIAGDLVVASLGEQLPRACLVPGGLGPAIVKADCIRVRLSDLVDPRWVLYALQRPEAKKWAADQLHGVGRQRLGMKAIKAIPIPLPPLDEQRRIVAILEDHLSRLDEGERSLQMAGARLSSLHLSLASELWRLAEKQVSSLTPVGEVVKVDTGPAFKSADFGGPGEGTRLLRGDNIDIGSLRWERTRTWPDRLLSGLEHLLVLPGDVILAMDRPVISAGLKIAMAMDADLPSLLVQRVARLRTGSRIDPQFLFAVLNGPDLMARIRSQSVGTQIPHITLSSIREYEIPVPPLQVQNELLEWFTEAADAVERLAGATEQLKRRTSGLRRTLLSAAFSGQLSKEPSLV